MSDDAPTVPCHFCGTKIVVTPRTWRMVTGWERKALAYSSRAGGSDISFRTQTGDYACDTCMVRKKAGLDPLQESLL